MKRYADALAGYELAVESREKMSSADPGDAEYLKSLAESYQSLGELHAKLAETLIDKPQAGIHWQQKPPLLRAQLKALVRT